MDDPIRIGPELEALIATAYKTLTGPEKAAAFRAWVNSFPANLHVLSLDDISRESIYRRDDA